MNYFDHDTQTTKKFSKKQLLEYKKYGLKLVQTKYGVKVIQLLK